MALSKTISDRGSHGHHTFTLTVTETAVNKTANTSTCSIKFTISPYQTGYNWEDFTGSEKPKGTVTFNGTSYSWDLPNYNGKSTVTLVSKTGITVKHGSDGKKTVSFSFSCSSGSTSYLPGSASGSGSLALTAIPRVPTVTQKVSSKTETSITMTWSSDLTIDTIRYSTNGGSSWTSKNVTDGKSGSYTVSGLQANTSYSVKTELHSKESGLSGQSSALSVKTYAWPYATCPTVSIYKEDLKITLTNPLNRSCTVTVKIGSTEIITQTGVTANVTLTSSWRGQFLSTIPNSATGTYTVDVIYSGNKTTRTGTFNATGANPTVQSVTYADTNATAQAVIQDDSKILQNLSTPRFTAIGTALYGATIASGKVEILGVTTTLTKTATNTFAGTSGVINSATNVSAKVTLVDTRGNSATKTVQVTMIAYALPNAIITLNRRNNYYSETDITVDANVAAVGSNAPTITARWKVSGAASWAGTQTLQDNVTAALNGATGLDNTKAWNVQVTIVDSFGGTTTYNAGVGIGLPILYIDLMLRSVGINCFPGNGVPFAVEGEDILGELFYKPGESLSITQTLPLPGIVTSSAKAARFTIPAAKSLANITSITVSECKGGVRVPSGGYMQGLQDTDDWVGQSGITVKAEKRGDHFIVLMIDSTSAFTGAVNNTPVNMFARSLILDLS